MNTLKAWLKSVFYTHPNWHVMKRKLENDCVCVEMRDRMIVGE